MTMMGISDIHENDHEGCIRYTWISFECLSDTPQGQGHVLYGLYPGKPDDKRLVT